MVGCTFKTYWTHSCTNNISSLRDGRLFEIGRCSHALIVHPHMPSLKNARGHTLSTQLLKTFYQHTFWPTNPPTYSTLNTCFLTRPPTHPCTSPSLIHLLNHPSIHPPSCPLDRYWHVADWVIGVDGDAVPIGFHKNIMDFLRNTTGNATDYSQIDTPLTHYGSAANIILSQYHIRLICQHTLSTRTVKPPK